MEIPHIQVVAVLMPLEINNHTIPHLKALTRSIEHTNGRWSHSTFKQHYTVLKRFILLKNWAKRRSHVAVAVQP